MPRLAGPSLAEPHHAMNATPCPARPRHATPGLAPPRTEKQYMKGEANVNYSPVNVPGSGRRGIARLGSG
jgi:hypothetical protein